MSIPNFCVPPLTLISILPQAASGKSTLMRQAVLRWEDAAERASAAEKPLTEYRPTLGLVRRLLDVSTPSWVVCRMAGTFFQDTLRASSLLCEMRRASGACAAALAHTRNLQVEPGSQEPG